MKWRERLQILIYSHLAFEMLIKPFDCLYLYLVCVCCCRYYIFGYNFQHYICYFYAQAIQKYVEATP